MAEAIGRLEAATRELAVQRVADGAHAARRDLAHEGARVLARRPTPTARRMEGMLAVVANMKPAALARLLMLVAAQARTDPRRIAARSPLPERQGARCIDQLLAPIATPDDERRLDDERGRAWRRAMAVDEDTERPRAPGRHRLASARRGTRARDRGRGLAHARRSPTRRAPSASALPQAARDGAFPPCARRCAASTSSASSTSMADAVSAARATLADPAVLADICRASSTDADAAIAGEILPAAGPAGAEALLDSLHPRRRGAALAAPAGAARHGRRGARRRAHEAAHRRPGRRDRDPAHARRARRPPRGAGAVAGPHATSTSRCASPPSPRSPIRTAPEAATALIKALSHPEPETQRFVVREIGRVKAAPAVHQLTRALEDLNVCARTRRKKEIIHALEQIGTPEAQGALRRTADRKLVMGRKSRELRIAGAQRARDGIDQSQTSKELTRSDRHAVPPRERRPARHAGGARRPRRPAFIAVEAPFATPEKLERARELVRTLAVAHTNATLYPTSHPLGRPVARRLRGRAPRARRVRLRRGHHQHLQGHALRREPGLLRGERHVPQARRGAARARHLGGHLHVDDDRRRDRRARRAPRATTASPTSRPRASFLEARGVSSHHGRRDDHARGRGQRAAQPRGARAGARELRRRRRARCATSRRRPSSAGRSRSAPLQRVVESMLDNLLQDPAAVLGLTAIKGHDDYTLNHSINVCILSLSLGSALGLDEEELRSLGLAGAALRHRQGPHPRGDPRPRPARSPPRSGRS